MVELFRLIGLLGWSAICIAILSILMGGDNEMAGISLLLGVVMLSCGMGLSWLISP